MTLRDVPTMTHTTERPHAPPPTHLRPSPRRSPDGRPAPALPPPPHPPRLDLHHRLRRLGRRPDQPHRHPLSRTRRRNSRPRRHRLFPHHPPLHLPSQTNPPHRVT